MTNVVVVFYKPEEARNMKNVLIKYGFHISACCSTGAQAMAALEDLSDGIVVCGSNFPDMTCSELRFLMPACFEMLLIASFQTLSEYSSDQIVGLASPLKVHELIDTLNMMIQGVERKRKKRREQPKVYNREEKEIIECAKALLMDRNGMSEEEAHRYIQKTSMESGTDKVETSQMILSLME